MVTIHKDVFTFLFNFSTFFVYHSPRSLRKVNVNGKEIPHILNIIALYHDDNNNKGREKIVDD